MSSIYDQQRGLQQRQREEEERRRREAERRRREAEAARRERERQARERARARVQTAKGKYGRRETRPAAEREEIDTSKLPPLLQARAATLGLPVFEPLPRRGGAGTFEPAAPPTRVPPSPGEPPTPARTRVRPEDFAKTYSAPLPHEQRAWREQTDAETERAAREHVARVLDVPTMRTQTFSPLGGPGFGAGAGTGQVFSEEPLATEYRPQPGKVRKKRGWLGAAVMETPFLGQSLEDILANNGRTVDFAAKQISSTPTGRALGTLLRVNQRSAAKLTEVGTEVGNRIELALRVAAHDLVAELSAAARGDRLDEDDLVSEDLTKKIFAPRYLSETEKAQIVDDSALGGAFDWALKQTGIVATVAATAPAGTVYLAVGSITDPGKTWGDMWTLTSDRYRNASLKRVRDEFAWYVLDALTLFAPIAKGIELGAEGAAGARIAAMLNKGGVRADWGVSTINGKPYRRVRMEIPKEDGTSLYIELPAGRSALMRDLQKVKHSLQTRSQRNFNKKLEKWREKGADPETMPTPRAYAAGPASQRYAARARAVTHEASQTEGVNWYHDARKVTRKRPSAEMAVQRAFEYRGGTENVLRQMRAELASRNLPRTSPEGVRTTTNLEGAIRFLENPRNAAKVDDLVARFDAIMGRVEQNLIERGLLSAETAELRRSLAQRSLAEFDPLEHPNRDKLIEVMRTQMGLGRRTAEDTLARVYDAAAYAYGRVHDVEPAAFYDRITPVRGEGPIEWAGVQVGGPPPGALLQAHSPEDVELFARVAQSAGVPSLEYVPEMKPVNVRRVATTLAKQFPARGRPRVQVGTRKVMVKGEEKERAVTRPMTDKEITTLVRQTVRRVKEGAAGALWYERSAADILRSTDNLDMADKMAQAYAFLSATQTVKGNTGAALRAIKEFFSEGQVGKAGRYPNKTDYGGLTAGEVLQRIFEGEDVAGVNWSGRKTYESFYANLLEHIDHDLYVSKFGEGYDPVTVDRWIFRGSHDKESGTNHQYDFSEALYKLINEDLQWGPTKRLQAAAWMPIKASEEGTDIATAARHYGDFMEAPEYSAHGLLEGAPNDWPFYRKMDVAQREAYTGEAARARVDALRAEGVPTFLGEGGAGVWREEGVVVSNPGGGVDVLVGAVRTSRSGENIHPRALVPDAERRWLDGVYAAISPDQDGAGWTRSFPLSNRGKGEHTSIGLVGVDRRFTPDEMLAVNEALETLYGTHTEGGFPVPNVISVADRLGVRIFDTSEGKFLQSFYGEQNPGLSFRRDVRVILDGVLTQYDVEWSAHVGGFVQKGGYDGAISDSGDAARLLRVRERILDSLAGIRSRYERDPAAAAAEREAQFAAAGFREGTRYQRAVVDGNSVVMGWVAERPDGTFEVAFTPEGNAITPLHELAHLVRAQTFDALPETARLAIQQHPWVRDALGEGGVWTPAAEEGFAKIVVSLAAQGELAHAAPQLHAIGLAVQGIVKANFSRPMMDRFFAPFEHPPTVKRAVLDMFDPAYGVRAAEGGGYVLHSARPIASPEGMYSRTGMGVLNPREFRDTTGQQFVSGQAVAGPQMMAGTVNYWRGMDEGAAYLEQMLLPWMEPLEGGQVKPGYVPLNPDLVRDWRYLEERQKAARAERLRTAEELQSQSFDDWFPEGTTQEMKEDFIAVTVDEMFSGTAGAITGDLYQVPAWVQRAVASEFAFQTTPRVPRVLTTGADTLQNVALIAAVYSKFTAYLLTNVPSNYYVLGAMTHWNPARVMRAQRFLQGASRDQLRMLDALVGSGAMRAMTEANLKGHPAKVLPDVVSRGRESIANLANRMADSHPRRLAMADQLLQIGYKTPDQFEASWHTPFTSPQWTELRHAAGIAENAMVKFRGLTPLEQDVIRRISFVYPWIKGATRYTVQKPFQNPILTSVQARAAEYGERRLEEEIGLHRGWLNAVLAWGIGEKEGEELAKFINVGTITPESTGGDVLQTLRGTAAFMGGRQFGPAMRSAMGLLGPWASVAARAFGEESSYARGRSMLDSFVYEYASMPLFDFVASEVRGYRQGSALLPDREDRVHRLIRFLVGSYYPRTLSATQERQRAAKLSSNAYETGASMLRSVREQFGDEDIMERHPEMVIDLLMKESSAKIRERMKRAFGRMPVGSGRTSLQEAVDWVVRWSPDGINFHRTQFVRLTEQQWDRLEEQYMKEKLYVQAALMSQDIPGRVTGEGTELEIR